MAMSRLAKSVKRFARRSTFRSIEEKYGSEDTTIRFVEISNILSRQDGYFSFSSLAFDVL